MNKELETSIKNMIKIFTNYKNNFSQAFLKLGDNLQILSKLPIVESPLLIMDNSILRASQTVERRLISSNARLTDIKEKILLIHDLQIFMYYVQKFDILNFDKNLLDTLEKQETLVKLCKDQGYVCKGTLETYKTTTKLLREMYKTIIEIYENCNRFLRGQLNDQQTEKN